MSFHKFQADQLFTGTQMLDDQQVLITNEFGIIQDLLPLADAGDDIQRFEGMITPGFVNAHCHLELSHLKGLIPEHTGLIDFVFNVVTQRHFPQTEIEEALATADEKMLAQGIVAVGDISNNTITLSQKSSSKIQYHTFIEVSGWSPAVAETRFTNSKKNYDLFNALPNANVSMAAHAPYSVSEDLWQLLSPTFTNGITTIHNQETDLENEFFKSGAGGLLKMYEKMNIANPSFRPTGKTSLNSYLEKYQQAKGLLLVHNTFTTEEDILFAQAILNNISWCLCINANLYIENALPPVDLLRKNGCQIVLGTDSLASNHSLSILDEMKTITQKFPLVPTAELLQWATLNGATALGMHEKLGSFDKGKQPGINWIAHVEDGKLHQGSTVKPLHLTL